MKVRKGDKVLVISGKDKGVEGKVIEAYPKTNKVLVEGVNRIKKHTANSAKKSAHSPVELSLRKPRSTCLTSWFLTPTAPRPGWVIARTRTARMSVSLAGVGRISNMTDALTPRLKTRYQTEIKDALQKEFTYENVMQIPGLTKVVVNMGVGDAAHDAKRMNGAVDDLTAITGQKPEIRLPASPSHTSNCAKVCPLAHASPCVATACGNSWTASSPPRCREFATSAVCRTTSSTVTVTTPSV